MTDKDCTQTSPPESSADVQVPAATRAPVTVVVPCFRCTATIHDAVASVAAQTWRPAQILLVEDGSGDGTLETLHRVAALYPPDWIKVIPLRENAGPSRARNTGWDQAQEPFVAFLDADDCWAPRKLELQMAALEADPDIALIAHRMLVRPRGATPPPLQLPAKVEIIGRRTLLMRNPFPTASVVLRRDLPLRFDEEFWRSEDYLLWSQIVFSGYRCARIDQVLAIWNKREPGAIGLSDDFAGVQRGRTAMRRKLVQQGLISRAEYVISSGIGMATRARRRLVLRINRQGPYRAPG